MTGNIYNYKRQEWTEIDTKTDKPTGKHTYQTPDGVDYEVNPNNPQEYRNA